MIKMEGSRMANTGVGVAFAMPTPFLFGFSQYFA